MNLPDFRLETYFTEHEFSAKYLLCTSDCETQSISWLVDDNPEEFMKMKLGYTETKGDPELRKQVANLYNDVSVQQVLVGTGAEESIYITMNSLLESGDHVIVQTPCYQSLFDLPTSIGCKVSAWELKHTQDSNWFADIDKLESLVQSNTKAIIINLPHNPTGYLMPYNQYNELVQIARKYGLYIFSDEVYRFMEYKEEDRLPSIADIYEKGIALGVLSKAFGFAGLRIGWLVLKDKDLYQKCMNYKNYLSICNSAPSEFLAKKVLQKKTEILKENLKIVSDNLILLESFFNRYEEHFEWNTPSAGSIAFPKLKRNINSDIFANKVLKEKDVLLLPASIYDYNHAFFRVGFGKSSMSESLAKFDEFMQEYLK